MIIVKPRAPILTMSSHMHVMVMAILKMVPKSIDWVLIVTISMNVSPIMEAKSIDGYFE